MSRQVATLFVGLTWAMSVCGSEQVQFEEHLLSQRNPTNYEFNASVKDVQKAITNAFDIGWRRELSENDQSLTVDKSLRDSVWHRGASLLWKGDGDSLSKGRLARPGNEEDAYLYGGGKCVGASPAYFKQGKPVVYFADFHLHLTPVGSSKTRLEVFTCDSCVATGLERRIAHGPALI